ncbi:MAG: NAD(P)-binding protein [Pseudomonadota bacterium]
MDSAPTHHFDAIVLGCGVSGMTVAHTLTTEGARCVVIDPYADAGGNHISRIIDGLEFDIGAIYFHTTDRQFELFPSLVEDCRPVKVKLAKLNRFGTLNHFPLDLRGDLGGARMALLVPSFLEAYARRALGGSPKNTEDYVRTRIGTWLYNESGLASYIHRVFGIAPSDIDASFARDRLGWLNRRSSLRYQIMRQLGFDKRISVSNHAVVRGPGGFSQYYTKATDALSSMGVDVRLGTAINAITRQGNTTTVHTEAGSLSAERVVSTIPLPIAAQLAGIEVPRLDHVRLLSLFVESTSPLATDTQIIYNFNRLGHWKRITVHSAFYGPDSGRTGLTVEVPIAPDRRRPTESAEPDIEAEFDDFARSAMQNGLARAPLTLLGSHILDYGYPILDVGCIERRAVAMEQLATAGIMTLGRQGGFDYLPSSTRTVRAAQDRLGRFTADVQTNSSNKQSLDI